MIGTDTQNILAPYSVPIVKNCPTLRLYWAFHALGPEERDGIEEALRRRSRPSCPMTTWGL